MKKISVKLLMRLVFLAISICLSVYSNAQKLEGKVFDEKTKNPISFATVHLIDLQSGIFTDEKGYFSFNTQLPRLLKIKVSAIGYESVIKQIQLPLSGELVFYLKEMHMELAEVTVSPATGIMQKHTISNVESRSMAELNNITATNLGEAISNMAGVYQVSTGAGISKPVVRGLSGMRVVTYLNGLRIENQQWGGDHGMGISELGIGNVEVVKGPASLLYGADALGGVVYFSDENYAPQNSKEAYAETQFESASMRTKNFVAYKSSKNNLRYSLFGNYSSNADYMLPNTLYVKNSRFSEANLKGALGYNKNNWLLNVRYNFLYNQVGLPGHTHDSIIVPELFQAEKSGRSISTPFQNNVNNFLLTENVFFLKNSDVKLLLGFTNSNLIEYEEKFTIPGIYVSLNNYNYNLKWRKSLTENTDWIVGAQGMFQYNRNNYAATGVLIPDANMQDNGIYSLFHSEHKSWEFQTGLRADIRNIQTLSNFKGNPIIQKQYVGYNYSAGVSKIVGNIKLRGNASTGFRPPHSSELLSNGVHHGTLRYEIGNVNLSSERATQFDVSTEFNSDHISLILNPFYNIINNYIYIEPQSTTQEGYPLFLYMQTAKAELMGGELGMHYHPHFAHRFHLENNVSYIYAEDDNGEALPLIPQTRFNTQLRYEFDDKSDKKLKFQNIALQHLFFMQKDRVASFETFSPAYQVINIGANMRLEVKHPVQIKFGVRNLLNAQYIDHLSRLKNIGLAAPGINFYLTVKVNITSS